MYDENYTIYDGNDYISFTRRDIPGLDIKYNLNLGNNKSTKIFRLLRGEVTHINFTLYANREDYEYYNKIYSVKVGNTVLHISRRNAKGILSEYITNTSFNYVLNKVLLGRSFTYKDIYFEII